MGATELARISGVPPKPRKRYAVGFRAEEVGLPRPKSTLVDTKGVISRRPTRRAARSFNYRALPIDVGKNAPLSCDRADPDTQIRGLQKRLCRDLPTVHKGTLRLFSAFVARFLRLHVVRASEPSFEAWLEGTPYNDARKAELRAAHDELKGHPPDRRACSHIDSFIKLESYPEYKEARWINSRHDKFKAYSGRFFKAIENVVYELEVDGVKPFIKHVPVPERAAVVRSLRRDGHFYYENDYKAFESHFTPEVMNAIECQLYRHCLKDYPEAARVLTAALTGKNKLHS